MVYRNNAGRLGAGFISVCLETRWLGPKRGFYVPGWPCTCIYTCICTYLCVWFCRTLHLYCTCALLTHTLLFLILRSSPTLFSLFPWLALCWCAGGCLRKTVAPSRHRLQRSTAPLIIIDDALERHLAHRVTSRLAQPHAHHGARSPRVRLIFPEAHSENAVCCSRHLLACQSFVLTGAGGAAPRLFEIAASQDSIWGLH